MAKTKKANKQRHSAGYPRQPSPPVCTDWDVDDAGRLVAVDETHHRLAVQQRDGSVRFVGTPGDGPGQFHYPSGVAVLERRAYVVDSWNHRVQVIAIPEGGYCGSFGTFGSRPGNFFCPRGIAVVPRGDREPWLAIADTNNRRVTFHAPEGRFLFSVDVQDTGHPRRIRIDDDGFIRVQSDTGLWARLY